MTREIKVNFIKKNNRTPKKSTRNK